MSVLSLGAARAGVITVAAASALALLALPSAAHAAEVVTCTQTATAETQPWLTFVEAGNPYEVISSAFSAFVDETSVLPASLPASFTAADLEAYNAQLDAAEAGLEEAASGDMTGDPLTELLAQLEAADPDNTSGWQEKSEALLTEFGTEVGTIGQDFGLAFERYSEALTSFSEAAADAVDQDIPEGGPYERPELPTTLAEDGATIVTAFSSVRDLYQSVLLDGAAANVVYVETCVTTTVPDAAVAATPAAPATLAATGTSDGIALGTTAGLLLLVGAAVTAVTARRRRSA